ncbi:MAG: flagellin [Candidatus Latescibacteria bacterium]|nr:flagellin [Candidatus Latescibacterota bacterium]
MALRVNTNIAALMSQRFIGRNVQAVNRQLERLASGLRVNRAADDASGLVVSEGMRGELSGLVQNVRNAEHAVDLVQLAEGSMQEVNNMLVRMRSLALQSSSSTLNDSNRESLAAEFSQLVDEVDRIAQATSYNGMNLLTGFGNQVSAASTALTASDTTGVTEVQLSAAEAGTFSFIDTAGDELLILGNGMVSQTLDLGTFLDGGTVATGTSAVVNFDRLGIQVTLAGSGASGATGSYEDGDLDNATLLIEAGTGGGFQIGPRDSPVHRLELGIADLRGSGETLGLDQLSINSQSAARQALDGLDQAIAAVSGERGKLGAVQNRLSHTISFSENEIENIQASEASIRDTDIAQEATELSRSRILLQGSSSMLIQANVRSIQALTLL